MRFALQTLFIALFALSVVHLSPLLAARATTLVALEQFLSPGGIAGCTCGGCCESVSAGEARVVAVSNGRKHALNLV